jgi:phosphoadenylyl-sulfate reductase (thioredoxin)
MQIAGDIPIFPEGTSPEAILGWAADRFAPDLAFSIGFGRAGCVLLHMIARLRLSIPVFTVDTGLLFPETYALWKRLEETYGVPIRAVHPGHSLDDQAAQYGEKLWDRDANACCRLRKVEPFNLEVAGLKAWVRAIRRDQTPERTRSRVIEQDDRSGLVRVSPLLDWTRDEVTRFVKTHDVPINALHAHGYPSIGCHPCTTPVRPGEDLRSGRWRGAGKTECGLHISNRPADPRSTQDHV